MNTLVRLNNRLEPVAVANPHRLDELFAGFFRPLSTDTHAPEAIKLDVSEDEKAYRVAAAIPGVKKEDIHVEVDQNAVAISAEIKRENVTREGERVLHSERWYGKTSRSFTVAQDIDESAVVARYTDGVLSLELPKKVATSAKRVTIE